MPASPVALLRAHSRHAPWNARGLAAHATSLVDAAGLRPTNASARAAHAVTVDASYDPTVLSTRIDSSEKIQTSTLVKTDLVSGTGAAAATGDTITVNYVGALYKGGKVFDASWLRKQTFPTPLGVGAVIAGWDQGLVGMRVGGRRELIIPPGLAYKAAGSPPAIPGNATLIFVIDLLAVTPPSRATAPTGATVAAGATAAAGATGATG